MSMKLYRRRDNHNLTQTIKQKHDFTCKSAISTSEFFLFKNKTMWGLILLDKRETKWVHPQIKFAN